MLFAAAERAKIEGEIFEAAPFLSVFSFSPFEFGESKTNAPSHELKNSLGGMMSTMEEEEQKKRSGKEREPGKKKRERNFSSRVSLRANE